MQSLRLVFMAMLFIVASVFRLAPKGTGSTATLDIESDAELITPTRKLRICVLNWRDLKNPAAGGAEVYTEHVLRRWARQGHEVTLFAAAVEGAPADEVVDGYRVIRRGSKLSVYSEAKKWYRLHGQGEFDVVIDQTNTIPFRAHKWVNDTPVVGFFHQTAEECWMHNTALPAALLGRYILEPHWLRGFRNVPTLTVSDSTAASLARFGVNDTIVIPEGYEPPMVPPQVRKEDRPTIAWCARLVNYKRPQDLLAAAEILRQQIPDLQVWFIGSGEDLEKLRAAAPEGVEYLGFVSNEEKLDRMARAHVHVATSVREGWGLVVSEAAAVGTPTVAYDTPGLRDSTKAANGVTCEPNPQALADTLANWLPFWKQNPPQALPYGGAHSWDHVANKMMEALVVQAGLS
ncbi:MAG: glycosyltransferase family 4 protein [Actinomycetes bacterium]